VRRERLEKTEELGDGRTAGNASEKLRRRAATIYLTFSSRRIPRVSSRSGELFLVSLVVFVARPVRDSLPRLLRRADLLGLRYSSESVQPICCFRGTNKEGKEANVKAYQ